MDHGTRRGLVLKAASQAQHVRMKCGISRTAAVDPFQVTEKRKCEVWLMSLPSLEGVYSPNPRPAIILGSQRPVGRRMFTCAHELGHHEFGHGMRVEELNSIRFNADKDPDEFLADMFAAFLLMSQGSVRRALKNRRIQSKAIEPMQIFRLASFLGVGYGTLIEHMTWTLGLLNPQQRKSLIKTQPKDLKDQFGGSPQSEVVLVDEFWRDRAVDLEVGDILIMHHAVVVEDNPRLTPIAMIDGQRTFKSVSRGYLRAFKENSDWAVNIRIAPKCYEGLARYRFLNDPEENLV